MKELKEKAGLAAGVQSDQAAQLSSLGDLSAAVLGLKQDLADLKALPAKGCAGGLGLDDAIPPAGGPDSAWAWAEAEWTAWAKTEEHGSGAVLSSEGCRAHLTGQTGKACLVELTTSSFLCLQKLRQLEHAVHFLEGRSELGFGLWHELCRVFWRHHSQWLLCRESADLAGMRAEEAGWKQARRDWLVKKWEGGCLVGTAFSLYLLTWRFQA